MRIGVRDILAEDVGYSRAFEVAGEEPQLENVTLTEPVNGNVTVARLKSNLLVQGQITTVLELECHRCLRTFTRPSKVSFQQLYSEQPQDDEMPIEGDQIDLAPLLEQELLVSLPIKLICRDDCAGVEGVEGKYTPGPSGSSLQDQARIKKG